MMLIVTAAED